MASTSICTSSPTSRSSCRPWRLVIQEDLEAVWYPHQDRRVPLQRVLRRSAHVLEARSVLVLHQHHCRARDRDRFRDSTRKASTRSPFTPDTDIQELYIAQNQAMVPSERAALLEEFYVSFYDNFSWIFLTEVSAASATAANINWPVGPAELRGEGSLTANPEAQDLDPSTRAQPTPSGAGHHVRRPARSR